MVNANEGAQHQVSKAAPLRLRASRTGVLFTAICILLLGVAIPVGPAEALTPNEKYVTRAYQDFFARAPSPAELTAGTTTLSGTTRHNYLTALLKTDAFLDRYVKGIYYMYLDRLPTTAELDAAIDAVQLSGDHIAAEADVLASAGYFGFAGGTNADYVGKLFADTYLREGSPTEISPYVSDLDLSLKTRRQVALEILRSTEAGEVRVRGVGSGIVSSCPANTSLELSTAPLGAYCLLLDRMAVAPEGTSWIATYSGGGQLTGIWVSFASSLEYWNLSQL